MLMANMAPGNSNHVSGGYSDPDGGWPFPPLLNPWIEAGGPFGGDPSLRLSFELAPSSPALAPSGPGPGAAPAMPEAKDSARHKADVAALLVYLAAGETAFPPLANTADAPPKDQTAWDQAPWDQALWDLVAGPGATANTRFPPSASPHLQVLVGEPSPWTDGMMGGGHRLAPADAGWLML